MTEKVYSPKKKPSKALKPRRNTERQLREVNEFVGDGLDLTPAPGETHQDAIRHAVVELRARGWTAREISKRVHLSERQIWNLIEAEGEAIDRKLTTRDEHRRNAARRIEILIRKYHAIASADKYSHVKFNKDGDSYIDDDALDLQLEAVKVLFGLEDRLAKLIGYHAPDEEKDTIAITHSDLAVWMAGAGIQKIQELKRISEATEIEIPAQPFQLEPISYDDTSIPDEDGN